MPFSLLQSGIGLSSVSSMPSTRSASRLIRASRAELNPGLREVKCESSVSFDISKSEMNSSVKRKRVNRVLEINGEHPKKVGIVPDIEDFRYDKIQGKSISIYEWGINIFNQVGEKGQGFICCESCSSRKLGSSSWRYLKHEVMWQGPCRYKGLVLFFHPR